MGRLSYLSPAFYQTSPADAIHLNLNAMVLVAIRAAVAVQPHIPPLHAILHRDQLALESIPGVDVAKAWVAQGMRPESESLKISSDTDSGQETSAGCE